MLLNIFLSSTKDLIAEHVDSKLMPNKLVIIDGTRYQVDKVIPIINSIKPTEHERELRQKLDTEPDLIDLDVDANLYVRVDTSASYEAMTPIDPMYNRYPSKEPIALPKAAKPTTADVHVH